MLSLRAQIEEELHRASVDTEMQFRSLRTYRTRVKRASLQLKKIKNLEELRFRVRIVSLWSREGEQEVSVVGKSLSKTMGRANAAFKKKNKRSDVQGYYHVNVFIPAPPLNDINFVLPRESWEQYIDKSNR